MSGYYNFKTIVYNDNYVVTKQYLKPIKTGFKRDVSNRDCSSLEKKLDKAITTNQALEIIERIKKSIKDSIYRTRNKIFEHCISNSWDYFITITFDPKKIDRSNYDLLAKVLSKQLNNIKNRYSPNLKYIVVPELHEDGLNWHYHALFSDIGNMVLVEAINPHTGQILKDNKGRTIYNLPQFNLGHTTATIVGDSDSSLKYLLKYITKETSLLLRGKKKYWRSRNLSLPQEITEQLTPDEILTRLQFYLSQENVTQTQFEIHGDNFVEKTEIQFN